MIRILSAGEAGALLTRKTVRLQAAEAIVRPIIDAVREQGDDALRRYARELDHFERDSFVVPEAEIAEAVVSLPVELRAAIETAAANIRAFAELQKPQTFTNEIAPGLRVGQLVRPLDTICAYIPAGRYPLVSTVLMTVIPAQLAGVRNICVTTPQASPAILGAAGVLGNTDVFLLGGAHAIAAFAFGTETIPRADRIVGPGNIYVAAAKKLLAGEVGIDFIAGPTEIVIIAADGNPAWLATDLLAQAEHDVDASAILLTTSRKLAEEVALEIERQLATLSTGAVARQAIEENSAIVLVDDMSEAVEWSNRFAPEHLSLHDESLVDGITHAGSIFLGPTSPEAAGDYATGPNHVLPTSGVARLRGGLSIADFLKVISTQQLSATALRNLAPAITTLARAEGLEAHARSVEVRGA
ncbi:MAG: histidinol dehydrogenase [Chthoniobacterales bacterium]